LFSYKESPKLIRRLRKVVSNQDLKGCFFKLNLIFYSILLSGLSLPVILTKIVYAFLVKSKNIGYEDQIS